jgi:hypothetical protein
VRRLYLIFRLLLFFAGSVITVFFVSRLILVLMQGVWTEPVAILVGVVLSSPGAGIIWHFFFMKKVKVAPIVIQIPFEEQTANLLEELNGYIEEVDKLAPKVVKKELQIALADTCIDAKLLLAKVEEKKELSLRNTTVIIGSYIRLIQHDILPQYIEMQNDQRNLFPNVPIRLENALEAIMSFDAYLRQSILFLEQDDMTRFDVAVRMLNPLKHTVLK